MRVLQEVHISPQPLSRFESVFEPERVREAEAVARTVRERMVGRVVWNVNSTGVGGGVAEMLRAILPYPRAAGIDARWVVISGNPEFFQITKRIHHALHGSAGDGSPLGEAERRVYEKTLARNAEELVAAIRPRDIVLLHDPQTAGLARQLAHAGAIVLWRCHVGHDAMNAEVERAWNFLSPYLEWTRLNVFSREAYIPDRIDRSKCVVVHPSIDPFSAKNQDMDDATVRAILVHEGIIEGPEGKGAPVYVCEDGSPGRVDHHSDVMRLGRAPTWETPLVVQVSRWDPLKDPIGVLHGFAQLVDKLAPGGAELVLAGPNPTAVADDPEGLTVLDAVIGAWRRLTHNQRNRVHLVCLPMADVEENAAIVNALQRHATVVVQKSLHEGFGLTVTEAMWKGRPVVASAVGGIQDQIEDGTSGVLLPDPSDLDAFGSVLTDLLENPERPRKMGEKARERAREHFLGIRHLLDYARLIETVDEGSGQKN